MRPTLLLAGASLAAGGTWTQVQKDWDTLMLAVAFSDDNNGVAPYDDNGVGAGVHVTSDGGATWDEGEVTQYTSLLMGAAAAGDNVVLAGTFDTQFSTDKGMTFNASKAILDKFVGQDCQTLMGGADDKFFGIAGNDILGGNGVAVSTNGGVSFKFHNISIANSPARYAAYVDANTWYVAAGEWPETMKKDPAIIREISSRLHHKKTADGKTKIGYVADSPVRANDDGWMAEIFKTTDAGATWTSQFSSTDYYMNGIDCSSATHCCAVGESDSGAAAGAHIVCTFDGETWSEQYYQEGEDISLIAMKFVGPDEAWAGGGRLNTLHFQGAFPHTVDGGKTWNNDTLAGVYGMSLSFPSSGHGYPAVLQRDEQSGLCEYK